MMKVPFFDLTRQYEEIQEEIETAVGEVLRSQQCIGGPKVRALERVLADRVGVAEGIGVSSGTDALLVSLMALGIGPGDEVITSPFTFFSPVESILRLGARPVFVDIDPETFNLDLSRIEEKITERTRAILPVHLFGQCCEMEGIEALAQAYGLAVVEDMAQAIDAEVGGRRAGSIGDLGCVSFFPTKNLGGAGDGGMVFTDDRELAAKVRRLARHGAEPKYHHREVGGNFRLDAIQAAVLLAKVEHLDRWTSKRRARAEVYDQALKGVAGVKIPVVRVGYRSVYNQYILRVKKRDRFQARLEERGVGTNIYYPEPLHVQPALKGMGYQEGAFPEAESACREVLALPIFPELTDQEQAAVIGVVQGAVSEMERE